MGNSAHTHRGDDPTSCEEHLLEVHGLKIDSRVAVDVHDALHGDLQNKVARLQREIEVAHQALDSLEPFPPRTTGEPPNESAFTLAGRIARYQEMLAIAQDFTTWTQPHRFRVVDTHGNHPPVYCWTRDAAWALKASIARGYDPGSRYAVQDRLGSRVEGNDG
jgi:hypothetical protein